VALVLHLMEDSTAPEITPSTAENAVALTNWLVHESERTLKALGDDELAATGLDT
jgi:hypothetical protein